MRALISEKAPTPAQPADTAALLPVRFIPPATPSPSGTNRAEYRLATLDGDTQFSGMQFERLRAWFEENGRDRVPFVVKVWDRKIEGEVTGVRVCLSPYNEPAHDWLMRTLPILGLRAVAIETINDHGHPGVSK